MLHDGPIAYQDGDEVFVGHVAYDDASAGPRPCIIVTHAWDGLNEPMRARTREYARLGHVGFALDVYGEGVRGGERDDNSHLMGPLLADRALLRRRLLAGVAAARAHPLVDPARLVVIGPCFGGLCALDVARSGAPGVIGVVSIHGVLTAPSDLRGAKISAKVLLLHGWEDPVAPPADVLAIARELTDAGADWQLHAYGHAMHAFTLPGANMPERGILHDPAAARRAAIAVHEFLGELLPVRGGAPR